jgi:hypothetical protein
LTVRASEITNISAEHFVNFTMLFLDLLIPERLDATSVSEAVILLVAITIIWTLGISLCKTVLSIFSLGKLVGIRFLVNSCEISRVHLSDGCSLSESHGCG